ncbi:MAG: hypothetical protein IJP17_05020, partial [Clostridia bacterium]|nr:hypothetical protein [Clostridia bacterium]
AFGAFRGCAANIVVGRVRYIGFPSRGSWREATDECVPVQETACSFRLSADIHLIHHCVVPLPLEGKASFSRHHSKFLHRCV